MPPVSAEIGGGCEVLQRIRQIPLALGAVLGHYVVAGGPAERFGQHEADQYGCGPLRPRSVHGCNRVYRHAARER